MTQMWLNKQIIALNLSKNFSIFKIKNTVESCVLSGSKCN